MRCTGLLIYPLCPQVKEFNLFTTKLLRLFPPPTVLIAKQQMMLFFHRHIPQSRDKSINTQVQITWTTQLKAVAAGSGLQYCVVVHHYNLLASEHEMLLLWIKRGSWHQWICTRMWVWNVTVTEPVRCKWKISRHQLNQGWRHTVMLKCNRTTATHEWDIGFHLQSFSASVPITLSHQNNQRSSVSHRPPCLLPHTRYL